MEALEMFGLGLAGVIWSRGGSHEVRSTSKLHKWSKCKKECDFYMRAAYLLHCVWETCAKNLIFFSFFFQIYILIAGLFFLTLRSALSLNWWVMVSKKIVCLFSLPKCSTFNTWPHSTTMLLWMGTSQQNEGTSKRGR